MEVTQEMYTKLFNAITDARKLIDEASQILDKAQQDAEEIYTNKDAD